MRRRGGASIRKGQSSSRNILISEGFGHSRGPCREFEMIHFGLRPPPAAPDADSRRAAGRRGGAA